MFPYGKGCLRLTRPKLRSEPLITHYHYSSSMNGKNSSRFCPVTTTQTLVSMADLGLFTLTTNNLSREHYVQNIS